MDRIYLDCNASTVIDPSVLKVMIEELEVDEGNPSSIHFHGRERKNTLDQCRRVIAHYLNASPQEIIFTSGGTEGAAMLIQGLFQNASTGHIISSGTEHPCVYYHLQEMSKRGFDVSFLPVGEWGAVRPEAVSNAIKPETRLIALMAANNETGVVTDIEAIAKIAQSANIPFIVDGVAWLGKERINIPPGVSACFFSGHKIHAPKGIGFCLCRRSLKLSPLFPGGGQEFNRRGGTENLSGIAALAETMVLLEKNQERWIAHMQNMRDRFEKEVMRRLPNVIVNGVGPRVCNTTNLAFTGMDGESLLIKLDMAGISASHGSACSSGGIEPSRVLLNMGMPLARARSSIRFSLSRMTTEEKISRAIEIVVRLGALH